MIWGIGIRIWFAVLVFRKLILIYDLYLLFKLSLYLKRQTQISLLICFTTHFKICHATHAGVRVRSCNWLTETQSTSNVMYVKDFFMIQNDHKRLGHSVMCSIDYWLLYVNRKLKWYEVESTTRHYEFSNFVEFRRITMPFLYKKRLNTR
jgi:hypothetical protein